MTMLTKLMCALKVTFSMKVSLTDMKEDDSEDTPCNKGKKTQILALLNAFQEDGYDSYNQGY